MKTKPNMLLNKLCSDVENLKNNMPINYIDAIIEWCENNNVDVEYAAEAIKKNPRILSTIEIEAENLNFLKKKARLPIDFAI